MLALWLARWLALWLARWLARWLAPLLSFLLSFLHAAACLQELGVLGHSEYKVSFMLDHSAMLTVNTDKYGEWPAGRALAGRCLGAA